MHNAEYSYFYFATFFPDYFNNGETSSTTIHRYFLNNKTICIMEKKYHFTVVSTYLLLTNSYLKYIYKLIRKNKSSFR